MKAADIMTKDVVTVGPDTEAAEVARLLLAYRISAAPVVSDDGDVIGMVSEADLMRRAKCGPDHRWWLALFADETAEFVRTHGTRARDLMTHEVVSIGKDTTLAEIAGILERHGIKRVPVIEDGRLVGIVSRSNVLRGLASLGAARDQRAASGDPVIEREIVELIKKHTTASLQAVSVIVDDGEVWLWGTAASEAEREAIRVAAENVVGTEKVHDNLN